jgi:hypothetical protein
MSKAKAMLYIDTIMGFAMPRVYRVLNLNNLAGPPNECHKTTGIAQKSNRIEFSLFPNPASDIVYVQLNSSSSGIKEAGIVDLSGKKIWSESFSKNGFNQVSLQTSGIPAGIYFVQIVLFNGEQATGKIVIR